MNREQFDTNQRLESMLTEWLAVTVYQASGLFDEEKQRNWDAFCKRSRPMFGRANREPNLHEKEMFRQFAGTVKYLELFENFEDEIFIFKTTGLASSPILIYMEEEPYFYAHSFLAGALAPLNIEALPFYDDSRPVIATRNSFRRTFRVFRAIYRFQDTIEPQTFVAAADIIERFTAFKEVYATFLEDTNTETKIHGGNRRERITGAFRDWYDTIEPVF